MKRATSTVRSAGQLMKLTKWSTPPVAHNVKWKIMLISVEIRRWQKQKKKVKK